MQQELKQITDRVFYLPPYQETDRPILAAVVGDEKTVLIDAGNSSSHANLFLKQLAERKIKGDWLVLTHWHWDHVFGMREMEMPVICQEMTFDQIKMLQQLSWEDKELDERVNAGIEIPFCADAIKEELGTQRDIYLPDPDIHFGTRMEINLGEITCVIEHVGGDHSGDSSMIYIPEEKVIFLGDCLYANLYAEKWNYTIQKTRKLIEQIETYDAEAFILSHHPAPLNKKEFTDFTGLLKVTARFMEKEQGDLDAVVSQLSKHYQRELNDLELETAQYFANGFTQTSS